MDDESNAALVERAQGGERAAIERLVRKHMRAAYAVALAILRNPADAEDVAHDCLLIAIERLDECEPERFSGWLMQIVRNRSLNAATSRARRETFKPVEAAPAPLAAHAFDARKALLVALNDLSENERAVVLLHDLEGWTHPEIGRALDLTEVNSRQALFRARRTLRAKLEELQPEAVHGRT